MIICFNQKINTFSQKSLKKFKNYNQKKQYIQSIMPQKIDISTCSCPYCKAKGRFVNYGTYSRNLTIFSGEVFETYLITVQRVICKSCGHTHALLPNFIVPYMIMAIFSISEIVSQVSKSSAYKVAEKIEASVQLIYNYISLVLSFFTSFKIMNNKNQYYNSKKFNEKFFMTNCVKCSTSNIRVDFFEFHSWILFMQKFRNNSSPPVTIGVSKMTST